MEQTLSTVHDALAEAAQEPKSKTEGPMGTHTFRIHDSVKEEARKLCENHGTSYDAFLRKCSERLVRDYRP